MAEAGERDESAYMVGGVRLISLRQAKIVRGFVRGLQAGGSMQEAALVGAQEAGLGGAGGWTDAAKIKHVLAVVDGTPARSAIMGAYELAGLPVAEVLQLHQAHMRGYTDADGAYHPPNYPALKDFLKMVLPEDPKRLNVLTARVPVLREARTDGAPPPMSKRPIGTVIDAE